MTMPIAMLCLAAIAALPPGASARTRDCALVAGLLLFAQEVQSFDTGWLRILAVLVACGSTNVTGTRG